MINFDYCPGWRCHDLCNHLPHFRIDFQEVVGLFFKIKAYKDIHLTEIWF